MASHSSVLVAGLVCLSAVVVVVPMSSWLAASAAAGEGSIGGARCETSCGGVDIPFPFGMGLDQRCWQPGFQIWCNDTGNGVLKPFMSKAAKVEVLNISLERGQVNALHHLSSYCYNSTSGKMVHDHWRWDLGKDSPYTFSSTANKFTVVGCRTLAYIGDIRGNTVSAKYETGCVAMCFDGKMSLDPCNGMGCCQTPIPKSLKYYTVWFDSRLNTSGIDDDGTGPCSFAVLMDSSNFTSSTSSSNNISSPEFINNNSSLAFNMYSSRGGKAPVVLDWSVGNDNCSSAVRNPEYKCRSINSFCSDAASGRGYNCKCNQGFHGDPYLTDGCQCESTS